MDDGLFSVCSQLKGGEKMAIPTSVVRITGWVAIMMGLVMVQFLPLSHAEFKFFQKISETQGSFDADLNAGDDLGESITGLGDLDLDGIPDIAVTAEDDDDGGSNRGAVYILFMNADGTVGNFQKISQTVGGFTGHLDNEDEFGNWVTALGDVDGDGITEIAVSAIGDDDGGINRGAIWILFLNRDGTVEHHQKISSAQGGFSGAIDNEDHFGSSLEAIGDFDNDGIPDLAAGTPHDDDGGINCGAVWLLMLNSDGTVKEHQKISETSGGFTGGLDNGDEFGQSLAAIGDFNGDGVTDLAVGAEHDDDGGTNRGALWLLMMNADGTVKFDYKISDTAGGFTGGLDDGDEFGQSVEWIGDFNGDGISDLAVGAEFDSDSGQPRGAAWIVYMNADGTVKSHFKINDNTPGFSGQLGPGDEFGQSIASIGDLDGDGEIEMAVAADGDDDGGENQGAVYVFFLMASSNHPPVLDLVGDRIVTEGNLLTFRINAADPNGDRIWLSSSALPQGASFDDNGDGTGDFSYLPGIGASENSPYTITFTATDTFNATDSETIAITVCPEGNMDAFQQDSGPEGILSIEAENFHNQFSFGIHDWMIIHSSPASQNAAMQVLPDDSKIISTGHENYSPRLDYHANFVQTGVHYIWIRGNGLHTGADSLHIGLDGNAVSTAANFKNFQPKQEYVWSNCYGKSIAINSTGVHTLNIYMRESGFIADKIVLTKSIGYLPTGHGPDESPTGLLPKVATPTISPDGGFYSSGIEVGIQTSTLDAEIFYTMDGSTPTPTSTPYTGSFWITKTATIKARAFLIGYTDSDVAAADFVIQTSTGLFQQDTGPNGIVCMEAENFHDHFVQGGHEWEENFTPGLSGSGAMKSVPDSGVIRRTDYDEYSPELAYRINFKKTGVHYIWIRGYGENTSSDSLHAGLDGQAVYTIADIKGFQPKQAWAWAGGYLKKINIQTAGEHTLNLWMREDGFIVDKLFLTTHAGYVPTGLGPTESPME
jgi:hypothetical protein